MNDTNRKTLAIFGVSGATIAILAAAAVIIPIRLGSDTESAEAADRATKSSSAARLEEVRTALEAVSEYINTERFGEAERILNDLAAKYPKEEAVLAQQSELLLHQGKVEEAYAVSRDLLAVNGTRAEYRFNAGLMANMLRRLDESAFHFQEATRLDPSNPQYPLYLAQILVKLHEYRDAEIHLLQVITLDPSVHEAYGTLAEIYVIQNNLDMASQQIARARKLAPDFLKWKLVEAKILRRRNKPQEALTLLNALPTQERQFQPVIDEIAQCWAMMGAPRKAAQVHIDYLNVNPRSLTSAIEASKYLIIAGDRDGATQWLSFAQRLNPDSEEVQRLAEQLGQ